MWLGLVLGLWLLELLGTYQLERNFKVSKAIDNAVDEANVIVAAPAASNVPERYVDDVENINDV
jgi:hypothetical protein